MKKAYFVSKGCEIKYIVDLFRSSSRRQSRQKLLSKHNRDKINLGDNFADVILYLKIAEMRQRFL